MEVRGYGTSSDVDRIEVYRNGDCVTENILDDLNEVAKVCTGKAASMEPCKTAPEKKTFFEAPCPRSYKGGNCSKAKQNWHCCMCLEQVNCGEVKSRRVLNALCFS